MKVSFDRLLILSTWALFSLRKSFEKTLQLHNKMWRFGLLTFSPFSCKFNFIANHFIDHWVFFHESLEIYEISTEIRNINSCKVFCTIEAFTKWFTLLLFKDLSRVDKTLLQCVDLFAFDWTNKQLLKSSSC